MYVGLHVKGLFPLSAIGMAVHLFHAEIQIDCDESLFVLRTAYEKYIKYSDLLWCEQF